MTAPTRTSSARFGRAGCGRIAKHAGESRDATTWIIEHPAGEEVQWDWFERRSAVGGGTAYVLLEPLAHSGRVRGQLCESMDRPHLIEAMDAIMRKLGGTARVGAHRPYGDGG